MKKPLCFWIGAATALFAVSASLPTQAKSSRHHRAATAPGSALIVNTGSGSLPGYRLRVTAQGRLSSVTVLRGGRASGGRTGQLAPAVTRRFFADLAQAAPLDRLPFGTGTPLTTPQVRVSVRYRGRQSPNLREAQSEAGKTLYADVTQIIQALRLPIPNTP